MKKIKWCKRIIIFLLFIIALMFCKMVTGTTYTVISSTTESQIQTWINSLNAGDTIQFESDEIWRQLNLLLDGLDGTYANKIVFTFYNTGERPILSANKLMGTFTEVSDVWNITDTDLRDDKLGFFKRGNTDLRMYSYGAPLLINGNAHYPGKYPSGSDAIEIEDTDFDAVKDVPTPGSTYSPFWCDVNAVHDFDGYDGAFSHFTVMLTDDSGTPYTVKAPWAIMAGEVTSTNNARVTTTQFTWGIEDYGVNPQSGGNSNKLWLSNINHVDFYHNEGDYAYNFSTNRLDVYSTGALNDSVVEYCSDTIAVSINNCSYLEFIGLEFQGGFEVTTKVSESNHITFQDCKFKGTPWNSILLDNSTSNVFIRSCEFEDIASNCIMTNSTSDTLLIDSCTGVRIGTSMVMGGDRDGSNLIFFKDFKHEGITIFTNNDLDSLGYSGFNRDGEVTTPTPQDIGNNSIKNWGTIASDGAAIYFFNDSIAADKQIYNNILYRIADNGYLHWDGQDDISAIYLDFLCDSFLIYDNMILGEIPKPILLHGVEAGVHIYDNKILKDSTSQTWDNTIRWGNQAGHGSRDDIGAKIYNNELVGRGADIMVNAWLHNPDDATLPWVIPAGTMSDTNIYGNPFSSGGEVFGNYWIIGFYKKDSLAITLWQDSTGFDCESVYFDTKSYGNDEGDSLKFCINTSRDSARIIPFDYAMDINGNVLIGGDTLQPFEAEFYYYHSTGDKDEFAAIVEWEAGEGDFSPPVPPSGQFKRINLNGRIVIYLGKAVKTN